MFNWPRYIGLIGFEGNTFKNSNLVKFGINLGFNPPGSLNVCFPLIFFFKSHPLYDQTGVFGAVFSLFCGYLYCCVSIFFSFFNLLHFFVFHPNR